MMKRKNKCSKCGALGHNKTRCQAPSRMQELGQSARHSRPANAHISNEFPPEQPRRGQRAHHSVSDIPRPSIINNLGPESSHRQSGRHSVRGIPRPTILSTQDNLPQDVTQGLRENQVQEASQENWQT